MVNPTKYVPGYSYSGWQASNPSKPLPAPQIDNDFANISQSINGNVDALKDIRRSDGHLVNGIVGPDALSPTLKIGFTFRGAWTEGAYYQAGDGVVYNETFYSARVAHTATAGNTPVDEAVWLYLFSIEDIVVTGALSMPANRFVGDGTTTDFNLTFAPGSALNLIVALDGVLQDPNEYSLVGGTTLQFQEAPPQNVAVVVRGIATTSDIPVPTDGSVSYGKLDAGNKQAVDSANSAIQTVTSRVGLSFVDHTKQSAVNLAEGGRTGLFRWASGNQSSFVAADPQQGLYVPPVSDATGASGAWVRQRDDYRLNVLWFGAQPNGTLDNKTAIQAAINFGNTGFFGGAMAAIYIPWGDYHLHSALQTGARAIQIIGDGRTATRLMAVQSTSGIEHGLTGVAYGASLELKTIGIFAVSFSCPYGINARFDKNSGGFYLTDVLISSFSSTYGFHDSIYAIGATRTEFIRCKFDGPAFDSDPTNRLNNTQINVHLVSTGNANASFVYLFDSVECYGDVNGFLLEVTGAPGDSGSLEGVIMRNCRGRTQSGHCIKLVVTSSLGSWWPPFYVMEESNWQGVTGVAYIRGVSDFHMTRCWHFVDGYLTGAPISNLVDIDYARGVFIDHNTFGVLPNAVHGNLIDIGANVVNGFIHHNRFVGDVSGTSSYFAACILRPGCQVDHADNQFFTWPGANAQFWDGVGGIIPSKVRAPINQPVDLVSSNKTALRASAAGTAVNYLEAVASDAGARLRLFARGTDTNVSIGVQPKGVASVNLEAGDGSAKVTVNNTGLGFFGGSPIAKPTGVAVTAAGIHAALVSLGLISA